MHHILLWIMHSKMWIKQWSLMIIIHFYYKYLDSHTFFDIKTPAGPNSKETLRNRNIELNSLNFRIIYTLCILMFINANFANIFIFAVIKLTCILIFKIRINANENEFILFYYLLLIQWETMKYSLYSLLKIIVQLKIYFTEDFVCLSHDDRWEQFINHE